MAHRRFRGRNTPRPPTAGQSQAARGPGGVRASGVASLPAAVVRPFEDALRAQARGDHALAARRYRDALAHVPDSPAGRAARGSILSNLGVALRAVGEAEDALRAFEQAVAAAPTDPDASVNLGLELTLRGERARAIECFQAARVAQPSHRGAAFNLGVALSDAGRADEAVLALRDAVELAQGTARGAALDALGTAYYRAGQIEAAHAAYADAVRLAPNAPDVLSNYGGILPHVGRVTEAEAPLREALSLAPGHVAASGNLSIVLRLTFRPADAEAVVREALATHPGDPSLLGHLAAALFELGRDTEADAAAADALARSPRAADALNVRGNVALYQNDFRGALSWYRQALAANPRDAHAHFNAGLAHLALGDYAAGWREFEWRWALPALRTQQLRTPRPAWQGEPLNGRTILVYGEQGLGDVLQFLRFARTLRARGAGRVVALVPRALARLVAAQPYIDAVVRTGDPLPVFDVHCPLMSLPGVLASDGATLAAGGPYLAMPAISGDLATVAARVRALPGLKVGLVWGGQTHSVRMAQRSVPFAALAPLWEIPGVSWVSLQKGPQTGDLVSVPAGVSVLDLDEALVDFASTAAAASACDLILTIDTSVVHLSGGLGVPTWALLHTTSDYRWMGPDPRRTPWYPGLRCFRQTSLNDWSPVIAEVAASLQLVLAASTPAEQRQRLRGLSIAPSPLASSAISSSSSSASPAAAGRAPLPGASSPSLLFDMTPHPALAPAVSAAAAPAASESTTRSVAKPVARAFTRDGVLIPSQTLEGAPSWITEGVREARALLRTVLRPTDIYLAVGATPDSAVPLPLGSAEVLAGAARCVGGQGLVVGACDDMAARERLSSALPSAGGLVSLPWMPETAPPGSLDAMLAAAEHVRPNAGRGGLVLGIADGGRAWHLLPHLTGVLQTRRLAALLVGVSKVEMARLLAEAFVAMGFVPIAVVRDGSGTKLVPASAMDDSVLSALIALAPHRLPDASDDAAPPTATRERQAAEVATPVTGAPVVSPVTLAIQGVVGEAAAPSEPMRASAVEAVSADFTAVPPTANHVSNGSAVPTPSAAPAAPGVIPSAAPVPPLTRLGITWPAGATTGWGVYGLNLLLQAAARGTVETIPFNGTQLDAATPVMQRVLAETLVRAAAAAQAQAAVPQGQVLKASFPVLWALGNGIGGVDLPVRGTPDVGVIFSEDTALDEVACARGRRFARLIAGSTWNAEVLRAAGLEHTVTCLQGIDPTVFAPGQRTGRICGRDVRGRFVVFSGGKLEYRKGQDLVVEAFRRFRQRRPEALLITAWHNHWPATMAELPAGGWVRGVPGVGLGGSIDVARWLAVHGVPFTDAMDVGLRPNAQMAGVYREADVALFPNRAEGGTNLVAMEVMASGVPTILSANTGHLDLIGAGEREPDGARCFATSRQGGCRPTAQFRGTDGWGESDPEELVELLERAYTDRAEAQRRAAAGARYLASLSWTTQIDRLFALVAEVC